MKQSGFYLLDNLIALVIGITAVAGTAAMAQRCDRAFAHALERRVAHELLDHARLANAAFFEDGMQRAFDPLGRPVDAAGKYLLQLTIEPGAGILTFWFSLRYRDLEGVDREYILRREVWVPYED